MHTMLLKDQQGVCNNKQCMQTMAGQRLTCTC